MFDEEDDILDAGSLQEIMDRVIENSMRSAYVTIEEMGMEGWLDEVPISRDRKLKIMQRMIQWFEDREEFEKCAFLLKGIKQMDC
jgi:hypothetical protein